MLWEQRVNASIKDVFSFVALAVAPFNVIKAVIDGVIIVVLYKYLKSSVKSLMMNNRF